MENNENQPVPIRDILDNPEHPDHTEVSSIMDKLKSGEISLCGCIGKVGNDPYCPCGMRSRGLTPSNQGEWTAEKITELNRVLSKYETE